MDPAEFVKALKACDQYKQTMKELAREAEEIAAADRFGLGEHVPGMLAAQGAVHNFRAFAEETSEKFDKHMQNAHDARVLLETIRDTTLLKDQNWAAGYQKLMQEK